MQKMKAYIITGLAADQRVFRHIRLPAAFETVYLPWLQPLARESLVSYALRMARPIDRGEPFILIGLSFGGMLVTEIAKRISPVQTVLISSIPSSAHLPGYYRLAGRLGIHKWIPVSLIKSASMMKRIFTTETSEDKRILQEMIRSSDPAFIKWALDAILHWKNGAIPERLVHIHGALDEILPVRHTRPTHIIPRAGHLLVLNRANEVNGILRENLPVPEG